MLESRQNNREITTVPPVNPRYPYTEIDIQALIVALLKQRDLNLAEHGTVLTAGKVYKVNNASITIAEPQLIIKGTRGQADPYKANALNQSVKEALELAKETRAHILLFPLHVNNNHWVMGCAHFTSECVSEVMVCDPMRRGVQIEYIRGLIDPIFKAHLRSTAFLFKYINSVTSYAFFTPPCDRQPDGVSCGVLVVNFIDAMVTKGKLLGGKDLTPEQVLAIRQKHVDADPIFAERQFNARVEDDISAHSITKPDASIFKDEQYAAFVSYIAGLASEEREQFFTVTQQFIKAESDLEILHTPKGSIDEANFALLQDLNVIAANEIKEWFKTHQEAIDPELFASFFEQTPIELKWQTKTGQVDGKGALLAFLPKAFELANSSKSSPRPSLG